MTNARRGGSEFPDTARRWLLVGLLTAAGTVPGPLGAQSTPTRATGGRSPNEGSVPPSAAQGMLQPGPQARLLARQVGTWDVVMTVRAAPDASPVTVSGMVAERTMIGLYLSEVMKPSPGSNVPDFRRMDYMTYDAVQARWEYTSMDTRAPIGIMFARSYAAGDGPEVTLYFDNFADPGLGPTAFGSVRARHVDKLESDDRHVKRQFWTKPGEPEWLTVQYEYTRRR